MEGRSQIETKKRQETWFFSIGEIKQEALKPTEVGGRGWDIKITSEALPLLNKLIEANGICEALDIP